MKIDSQTLSQEIKKTKLLPLYTVHDMEYLDILEKTLLANDVKLIEITFRSELAVPAIKQLSKSGKLIVGAGTVRTTEEAKLAIENGAQFIVSPAVIPNVIEYCLKMGTPIFPGVATPTEIQTVVDYGIKTVKFFPANIYGGLKAINTLSGPFYDVKFLPTGGIDENNILEYIENKNIIAVGGSFIISEEVIKKDDGQQAGERLNALVAKIQ